VQYTSHFALGKIIQIAFEGDQPFSTHLVSSRNLSTASLRQRETFCLIETIVLRCFIQSLTQSQTLQGALHIWDLPGFTRAVVCISQY